MESFLTDERSMVAARATNDVQAEPDDSDALHDVTVGKVVFDINSTDPKDLAIYLWGIGMTHDDLLQQGVKPEIILAFRGHAVSFISTDRKRFSPEQHESLDQIAEQINHPHQKGVRMESCALAMRALEVEQENLLTGIKTVGNTFISLTGYQMKGYGVIPIY